MAENALQKIVKAAKIYRRSHPKVSWKEAVKLMSKTYRNNKKIGAAKKAVTKKPVIKKAVAKNKIEPASKAVPEKFTVTGKFSGVTDMYKVRDLIERQLQSLVKSYNTNKPGKTATQKAFLRSVKKSIAVTKKQLRDQNKLISDNLK